MVQTGVGRGSSRGVKKWSDSGYNVKVETQGLPDVDCERKESKAGGGGWVFHIQRWGRW